MCLKDENVCFIDPVLHCAIWFMGCTHFHGHCSRTLQFGAPFDVDELASLHELYCDQTLKLNSLPA